jgi:hypothetical protein
MPDISFPASIATPASTIDDVIHQLTAIVEWSKQSNSRIGYFAALYRKVTAQVQNGVEEGLYDDGPRMECLVVIFANRYIHACHMYQTNQMPTRSWVRAFVETKRWWPIVMQHLLMSMNAHINLDLGIATAETVPPEELPNMKGDFDKINHVLASLMGDAQNELAQIWPLLGLMNRHLGNVETVIINFSMGKARDAAWSFAETLSYLSTEQRQQEITNKDKKIALFSNVIAHPGFTASFISKIIRLGERGTIRQLIETLERIF